MYVLMHNIFLTVMTVVHHNTEANFLFVKTYLAINLFPISDGKYFLTASRTCTLYISQDTWTSESTLMSPYTDPVQKPAVWGHKMRYFIHLFILKYWVTTRKEKKQESTCQASLMKESITAAF